MKTAILYARVSTQEQAAQNNSLPLQEKKLKEYAKALGSSSVKLFKDSESARSTDRPDFQKMLKYVEENRKSIKCVVVCDLSRLARNVVDQGQTIAKLKQWGIELVSIDEPITDDTAAGKLARNMLGSFNQFFSDALSEKTKDRMKAGVKAGKWLWVAPIGYVNGENKTIAIDPQRAQFIRKAFDLMANPATSGDSVLRLLTGLGLTTRKGRPVTKQTLSRMLTNPFYCGWVVSGDVKVRGNHEPLITEQLFEKVQARMNGQASPHKKLNEDFQLRGFVRCAECQKPLTAGWAKGRNGHYAHYWCWTKGCKGVRVSKERLESAWLDVLRQFQPCAADLARLPEIAARSWEARKTRIAADARTLSTRLTDQRTLNQRAITARLQEQISEEDFQTVKKSIAVETALIESQIKALDSERCSMEDLMKQTQEEEIDFAAAWEKAGFNQKREIQTAMYPEGLVYSQNMAFFEPSNHSIMQSLGAWTANNFNIGVPDGI